MTWAKGKGVELEKVGDDFWLVRVGRKAVAGNSVLAPSASRWSGRCASASAAPRFQTGERANRHSQEERREVYPLLVLTSARVKYIIYACKGKLEMIDEIIEYLRAVAGVEVAVSDVRGKLRLTPMVASLYDFVRCRRAESVEFALLIERPDAIVKPTSAAIESHVLAVPDIDHAVQAEDGNAVGIFIPSPWSPICK